MGLDGLLFRARWESVGLVSRGRLPGQRGPELLRVLTVTQISPVMVAENSPLSVNRGGLFGANQPVFELLLEPMRVAAMDFPGLPGQFRPVEGPHANGKGSR